MLQRIISPFKQFGLIGGMLYAMDRTFRRITSKVRLYFYDIVVQPVPENPLLPSQLAAELTAREIRRGDPELALMPARDEIKESRFRQDAVCLGVYRKNQLIGYIWFCFGQYEEDEVRCVFVLEEKEVAAFDFDLYIFPEHRMGRAFIGTWSEANKFLRSRGVQFTFSRVTRFNVESRRAHAHLGSTVVGQALFLRTWDVQLTIATLFPYVHLCMGRSPAVRMRLRANVAHAAQRIGIVS